MRAASSQLKPWMEYCIAAASSPLAPPNCSRSMRPNFGSGFSNGNGVHEFLDVVIHSDSGRFTEVEGVNVSSAGDTLTVIGRSVQEGLGALHPMRSSEPTGESHRVLSGWMQRMPGRRSRSSQIALSWLAVAFLMGWPSPSTTRAWIRMGLPADTPKGRPYNRVPMPEATQQEPPAVVRFGDYELDRARGVLLRGGAAVKLQPQPLRALVYLIECAPRIVSREELGARIWGEGVHVEMEQGLNYCIRQIRQALDDRPMDPKFVETLPRQGVPVYRHDDARASGSERSWGGSWCSAGPRRLD